MSKMQKLGFTLIEVALFLAVTGALFIGIAVGTGNTIAAQRFNDSVQNFAELLRSVYAEVANPQSAGEGRSEIAIYGKLVVFGEKVGLDGVEINYDTDGTQRVFVYDVVGKADVDTGITGSAEGLLANLGANVVTVTETDGSYHVAPAGLVENYIPRWGASIEKTGSNELFKGSILIVRHPRSGTINTLVSDKVIEVNETVKEMNETYNEETVNNLLKSVLEATDESVKFKTAQVDFCINPYGSLTPTDLRRDIRLVKNARNASGVEIIDLDSEDNLCTL